VTYLRHIIEFFISATFLYFLFIAPYSRRGGKSALIVSLVAILVYRLWAYARNPVRLRVNRSFASYSVIFCLVSCAASVIFSYDPYQSQKIFTCRYVFFMLAVWSGYVMGRDFGKSRIVFLAYGILAIAAYMAIGAGCDYSKMSVLEPRLWTVWGRYTAFNMLPLFLVYFLSFSYAFLIAWGNGYFKWFGVVNCALLCLDIIWQQCRSAYPAVIAGISFVHYFKSKKVLVIALSLVLAVIVGLSAASPGFRAQIAEYGDMNQWDNRLPLFNSALRMFAERPVAGTGIGMFEKLIRTAKYEPPPDYMPMYRDFFIHTHNFYLETLAEMGILGAAFFIAIFAVFFVRLAKAVRRITDDTIRTFLIGLGSIIAVYLVFGITLSIITVGLNESSMFWLFFGLGWGLIKREEAHG